MAFAETARLIASLELEDHFSKGIGSASKSLGTFNSNLQKTAGGAGKVASGLVRAGSVIAAGVATGLGAAAKAAIDYQDAFQGVVKTVDEADLNSAGLTFEGLSDSIRKMSREMPNTAIELAGIAAAAGAMGVKGKDIEAFTKQVAILAATTNVSADDAATALGQLQNVIGLTGDEFDNFAAALVDLGNKGASTESSILEIEKRAGGAAKLFGIAKEETLGWAAAAANLGLNEEAAGTNLSKLFGVVQLGAIKGSKALSKIMGKSAKEIKTAFKKDASGALQEFIGDLAKLPKDARLKAIRNMFGNRQELIRLVNGLADSFDTNLVPSINDSVDAWRKATAAQAEFDKRNATVRSAISRLKNNLIDAAVTIGSGFAPALGRAADKLSKFLSQGENRKFLTSLGEDIGKAIDRIDWDDVLRGGKQFIDIMKIAFDYAKRIFDVINSLPTEIKAAGLGFLTLNKLSRGLIGGGIGDIFSGLAGGLVKSLGAKIPGIGGAFVQPVFVTNMPVGGLGGGVAGAAGGGLGVASKLFLVGEAIGLVAAVEGVREEISAGVTKQATAIHTQTQDFIASQPGQAALLRGLSGVDQGIKDIKSNPLHVLVQGDALNQLEGMRSDILKALETTTPGKLADDLAPIAQTKDIASMSGKLQDDLDSVHTAAAKAGLDAATASRNAGSTVAGATAVAASGIEGAIRANRPVVTTDVKVYVTAGSVTKSVTQQNRYGPANGSAGGGFGAADHPGGGGA